MGSSKKLEGENTMKDVIKKINDFLGMTTGLLINLIVAGTIIGILYDLSLIHISEPTRRRGISFCVVWL